MKTTDQRTHSVVSYRSDILHFKKKIKPEAGQKYISKEKLVEWQLGRSKYSARWFLY